jgi:hypothetical protein
MRVCLLGLSILAACSSVPDKCKVADAGCPEPVGVCRTARQGEACPPDAGTCPGCNTNPGGHSTFLTCTGGRGGGTTWVLVSGTPDPDCVAR